MDDELLYRRLSRLVETMPDLTDIDAETARWLGRVDALMAEAVSEDILDDFQIELEALAKPGGTRRYEAQRRLLIIIFSTLARAELKAPAGLQGSFIPVGHGFDVFVAMSKILNVATSNVLMIDPYMDATAVADFSPLVPERVRVHLLADAAGVKPSLTPAIARWQGQYDDNRPLEARLAPPRSLHDRLIIVDDKEVWLLTQSLKDFAARSPGSITQVDPSAAELKTHYYLDIWAGSDPLQ